MHVSKGSENRTHQLAARCQKAYAFFSRALECKPNVSLLVLAPEHWQEYTGSPMFGVPQTVDEQTVVVAGQHAERWNMIIPLLDMLPPSHAKAIQHTYGQEDGSVDVAGYMKWVISLWTRQHDHAMFTCRVGGWWSCSAILHSMPIQPAKNPITYPRLPYSHSVLLHWAATIWRIAHFMTSNHCMQAWNRRMLSGI
ncbi:hypothetical protein [Chloroflexus sp.]|uniref:hypothetical protein n=1 Tax=Chloroflexus sp. TaxID=1904827 RepID=UPI00258D8D35|nr:hypothetical protein [Chloroflexus sp.]